MTLLLRYLLAAIGLGGRPGDDTPDPADNNRGLALAVGVTSEGIPIFARMRGLCEPLFEGYRGTGLISGVNADGLPVVAWSDQRCKAGTDHLEAGKKYLGLVTGVTQEGIPIISSWCERCGVCTLLCTRHGGMNDAPATLIVTDSELDGYRSVYNLSLVGHNPATINKGFTCLTAPPYYSFPPAPTRLFLQCLQGPPFDTAAPEDVGKWYFNLGSNSFVEILDPTSLDPFLLEITGEFQSASPFGTTGNASSQWHGSIPDGTPYEIIITEP